MGFFSKLFSSKEPIDHNVTLMAHMTGNYVPLKEVPDPVFSEEMMGEGFAIEPTLGEVYSPVAGEIVQVFPTKHAVGIRTKNGLEILIHIGLETVALNGEGFETHVTAGDKIEVGQKLVTFDLPFVQQKAKSIITPCIITNMDKVRTLDFLSVDQVDHTTTAIANVVVQ